MNRNQVESMRFRLSVPGDDKAVLSWIGKQHNLSMSLRYLIKQAILSGGYKDVFASNCDELVQQPKRGRPKAQAETKSVSLPEELEKPFSFADTAEDNGADDVNSILESDNDNSSSDGGQSLLDDLI